MSLKMLVAAKALLQRLLRSLFSMLSSWAALSDCIVADEVQVVTKVSKEQNTTVILGGSTTDFKMRVFVCNSVTPPTPPYSTLLYPTPSRIP